MPYIRMTIPKNILARSKDFYRNISQPNLPPPRQVGSVISGLIILLNNVNYDYAKTGITPGHYSALGEINKWLKWDKGISESNLPLLFQIAMESLAVRNNLNRQGRRPDNFPDLEQFAAQILNNFIEIVKHHSLEKEALHWISGYGSFSAAETCLKIIGLFPPLLADRPELIGEAAAGLLNLSNPTIGFWDADSKPAKSVYAEIARQLGNWQKTDQAATLAGIRKFIKTKKSKYALETFVNEILIREFGNSAEIDKILSELLLRKEMFQTTLNKIREFRKLNPNLIQKILAELKTLIQGEAAAAKILEALSTLFRLKAELGDFSQSEFKEFQNVLQAASARLQLVSKNKGADLIISILKDLEGLESSDCGPNLLEFTLTYLADFEKEKINLLAASKRRKDNYTAKLEQLLEVLEIRRQIGGQRLAAATALILRLTDLPAVPLLQLENWLKFLRTLKDPKPDDYLALFNRILELAPAGALKNNFCLAVELLIKIKTSKIELNEFNRLTAWLGEKYTGWLLEKQSKAYLQILEVCAQKRADSLHLFPQNTFKALYLAAAWEYLIRKNFVAAKKQLNTTARIEPVIYAGLQGMYEIVLLARIKEDLDNFGSLAADKKLALDPLRTNLNFRPGQLKKYIDALSNTTAREMLSLELASQNRISVGGKSHLHNAWFQEREKILGIFFKQIIPQINFYARSFALQSPLQQLSPLLSGQNLLTYLKALEKLGFATPAKEYACNLEWTLGYPLGDSAKFSILACLLLREEINYSWKIGLFGSIDKIELGLAGHGGGYLTRPDGVQEIDNFNRFDNFSGDNSYLEEILTLQLLGTAQKSYETEPASKLGLIYRYFIESLRASFANYELTFQDLQNFLASAQRLYQNHPAENPYRKGSRERELIYQQLIPNLPFKMDRIFKPKWFDREQAQKIDPYGERQEVDFSQYFHCIVALEAFKNSQACDFLFLEVTRLLENTLEQIKQLL